MVWNPINISAASASVCERSQRSVLLSVLGVEATARAVKAELRAEFHYVIRGIE